MKQTVLLSMIFDLLKVIVPILIGVWFLGAVGVKLISYLIDQWLNKLNKVVDNEPGYITGPMCKQCQGEDIKEKSVLATSLNDLKKETRDRFGELRGIMMIVALKAGVAAEELKDLTK